MSKYDAKVVEESWEIERDKAHRKVAKGLDGARMVRVWQSDCRDAEGEPFPVMGKYLVPIADPIIENDVLVGAEIRWVTKSQANKINSVLKHSGKDAGVIAIMQILAKLLDKVFVELKEKIPVDDVFEKILDGIFQSMLDKLLDEEFIFDMLDKKF